ncbi:hypothetical protein HK101_003949 [Irineochytrium annulatum]|nr:hypothetical protein HK101_003949 [Irineochytrium annulatum]
MDTFVDSSWYWLRYLDPKNDSTICHPSQFDLLPVDTYIGGVEHSILHLLYARFLGKFLLRSGIVSGTAFAENRGEPFSSLLSQGMVTGKTYRCSDSGRCLKPEELDFTDASNPTMKASGKTPVVTWEKMSKSKYNGTDPLEVISYYGSDCARLSILYKTPPSDDLLWDEDGTIGMERWLSRCWRLVSEVDGVTPVNKHATDAVELRRVVHRTIDEVTRVMVSTRTFNTGIAALIKLTHALESFQMTDQSGAATYAEGIRSLITMMTPYAPCAASEMWERVRPRADTTDAVDLPWPTADETAMESNVGVCVIMVNGKVRGNITVANATMESSYELEKAAVDSDIGKKWLFNTSGKRKPVKKVLVLKGGKVINFLLV